ncbi:MAG: sulfatase-like hydrolase/transferase, partial [Myxococcota bacterium]|nr:sulfatase-like hydrolase/transferase [Myxococcota bacterium]
FARSPGDTTISEDEYQSRAEEPTPRLMVWFTGIIGAAMGGGLITDAITLVRISPEPWTGQLAGELLLHGLGNACAFVGALLFLTALAEIAGASAINRLPTHGRLVYAGTLCLAVAAFEWGAGGQSFTPHKLVLPARLGWLVASSALVITWLRRPHLFEAGRRGFTVWLLMLVFAVAAVALLFGNSVVAYSGKYVHESSLLLMLYGLGLVWLSLTLSSRAMTWRWKPSKLALVGALVWMVSTGMVASLSEKSRFRVGTTSEVTRSIRSWNRGIARVPPLSSLPWLDQYASPRSPSPGKEPALNQAITCTRDGEAQVQSVFLLTFDALRHDLFGLNPETDLPNYKRLMDRSLIFENAMQVNSGTMGSITAMHLGRHLTAPSPTLDLWPNVAALSNSVLSDSGKTPDFMLEIMGNPEQVFTDQILEKLRSAKNQERPFMLHAHYLALHLPSPDKSKPFLQRTWERMWNTGHDYQEKLRLLDVQLGRLLDALDSSGLSSNTLLILSADHGEELLEERGFVSHGFGVTNAVMHTPLLVSGPSIEPDVRTEVVSAVDITPTILDALGVSCDIGLHGRTLLSPGAPRPAFGSSAAPAEALKSRSFVMSDRHMCMSPPWKLILDRTNQGLALYNLNDDPLEKRNLADEQPEITANMRKGLELYLSGDIENAEKTLSR